MMNATLRGKPDARNPHVRFDEGEVASAKPRRGSLLYRLRLFFGLLAVGFAAVAAKPKYVFVFIGDGMSTPQRMTAEEFGRVTGYGPLAMNALRFQCTTRTRSANAVVTDSAAAATAIACGEKADNTALGITPDGRRLESVAVFAKARGMKVGVMTTVPIVHATPAGFYAHRKSRGDSYGIALDLLASNFDFFAGGGVYNKYDDRKHAEYRGNVFELAAKAGYAVVRDKAAFAALRPGCGKAWGVFADNGLAFAIDNRPDLPDLAEMVSKAVELLEGPEGFFIMAEGGEVDHCAHANDAAAVLREVISTDRAVKVALEFMKRHPGETLVVTTGDHETGGMSMGFAGLGYKFHVGLLTNQTCSAETFSDRVAKRIEANPAMTFAEARPLVTENFGLVFDRTQADTPEKNLLLLDAAEVAELERAFAADVEFVRAKRKETRKHDVTRRRKFAAACRRLLDNHAGVGWSTGAHTALPTLTTAEGCGAEVFTGLLENTDIAKRLKDLLR